MTKCKIKTKSLYPYQTAKKKKKKKKNQNPLSYVKDKGNILKSMFVSLFFFFWLDLKKVEKEKGKKEVYLYLLKGIGKTYECMPF